MRSQKNTPHTRKAKIQKSAVKLLLPPLSLLAIKLVTSWIFGKSPLEFLGISLSIIAAGQMLSQFDWKTFFKWLYIKIEAEEEYQFWETPEGKIKVAEKVSRSHFESQKRKRIAFFVICCLPAILVNSITSHTGKALETSAILGAGSCFAVWAFLLGEKKKLEGRNERTMD